MLSGEVLPEELGLSLLQEESLRTIFSKRSLRNSREDSIPVWSI